MTNDSAFKDPLVSRVFNEGIVLGPDANAVQKQSLFEMCSHMNSCISVFNANFQGLRLIAEAGAEADLELKTVKDSLNEFKNRSYVAEQQVRDLTQELSMKKNEVEILAKTLIEELNNHRLTYEAWKACCDDLTYQLNDLGSPEEGETREVEEQVPSTPKDSLDRPVGEVVKYNMQTD
ncbi:hypothetical protein FRX31_008500 [Thalictrum thalictroides]|uniref:Uncharacterized protein n=1 Tax=Thalictrum thalictroides TaxID=46969 RepID=A0A7J6WXW5_THATH|nr:hypothetical protein FRX31_008500 [Thalictrum thalictroides]